MHLSREQIILLLSAFDFKEKRGRFYFKDNPIKCVSCSDNITIKNLGIGIPDSDGITAENIDAHEHFIKLYCNSPVCITVAFDKYKSLAKAKILK